jgi:hypothetical protein
VSSSFARARGRKDRRQVAAFSLALYCCSGRSKRRNHAPSRHDHYDDATTEGPLWFAAAGVDACWARETHAPVARQRVSKGVVMMSVRYSVILGLIGTNRQIARVLAVQCD